MHASESREVLNNFLGTAWWQTGYSTQFPPDHNFQWKKIRIFEYERKKEKLLSTSSVEVITACGFKRLATFSTPQHSSLGFLTFLRISDFFSEHDSKVTLHKWPQMRWNTSMEQGRSCGYISLFQQNNKSQWMEKKEQMEVINPNVPVTSELQSMPEVHVSKKRCCWTVVVWFKVCSRSTAQIEESREFCLSQFMILEIQLKMPVKTWGNAGMLRFQTTTNS